jgi:hypothetical protein
MSYLYYADKIYWGFRNPAHPAASVRCADVQQGTDAETSAERPLAAAPASELLAAVEARQPEVATCARLLCA